MFTFPVWLLPLLLFGVWTLQVIAAAGELAKEDIRRGTPDGQRRGVSIFPGLPLFPLFFWGVAWLVDLRFYPWGTVILGTLHLIFALVMIASLVRFMRNRPSAS